MTTIYRAAGRTSRILSTPERRYVESARVARLATVDPGGTPHAVPICFSLDGDRLVTAIDEKPKSVDATDLTRVRNIEDTPHVAVLVDHYTEDWSRLGWVRIDGTAALIHPEASGHESGIAALRSKYAQYADHELGLRPLIAITPTDVVSWGCLDAPRGGSPE